MWCWIGCSKPIESRSFLAMSRTTITVLQSMMNEASNMKASQAPLWKKIIRKLQRWFCKASDDESIEIDASTPLADYFLRGFNIKDCITGEKNVAAGAFQFGDHTDKRQDNYHEASVNWEDDSNAVATLLTQKKEGTNEQMFKFGYARLPLNLVRAVLHSYVEKGYVDFERRPIDGNSYHGNILLRGDVKKAEKIIIQSNLAAIANNDAHIMNL